MIFRICCFSRLFMIICPVAVFFHLSQLFYFTRIILYFRKFTGIICTLNQHQEVRKPEPLYLCFIALTHIIFTINESLSLTNLSDEVCILALQTFNKIRAQCSCYFTSCLMFEICLNPPIKYENYSSCLVLPNNGSAYSEALKSPAVLSQINNDPINKITCLGRVYLRKCVWVCVSMLQVFFF